MFRLLTGPKVHELIKNEILWGTDIHLSDWWTVVHLFSPLKCTSLKLIPFAHRIEVGFEPAVHVDGIDRDICSLFPEVTITIQLLMVLMHARSLHPSGLYAGRADLQPR